MTDLLNEYGRCAIRCAQCGKDFRGNAADTGEWPNRGLVVWRAGKVRDDHEKLCVANEAMRQALNELVAEFQQTSPLFQPQSLDCLRYRH